MRRITPVLQSAEIFLNLGGNTDNMFALNWLYPAGLGRFFCTRTQKRQLSVSGASRGRKFPSSICISDYQGEGEYFFTLIGGGLVNAGKLPGVAEKRSVLRYTKNNRVEAAKVSCSKDIVLVSDSALIKYVCQISTLLDRVLGLLAAERASEPTIAVTVLVPEEWEENSTKKAAEAEFQNISTGETDQRTPENVKDFIRALLNEFRKRELSTRFAVNVQVSPGKPYAWISLSASGIKKNTVEDIGKTSDLSSRANDFVPENYSIVMAGYTALEATRILLAARWEILHTRLPKQYLDECLCVSEITDVRRIVQIATEEEALVKLPGEGGVFTALWEIGEFLNCGMEVDLKKILIRQETIEVCEWLDINPYLTFSGGCVLAVTDRPDALLKAYENQGIFAAVLGRLKSGKDRIIQNNEEERFLEPFRQDELYRAHIFDI